MSVTLVTNYTITIPHHISRKAEKSLIPKFKKGNWETIFVLKDNSKITLYTYTQAEGNKVLEACKKLVNPKMLVGAYLSTAYFIPVRYKLKS